MPPAGPTDAASVDRVAWVNQAAKVPDAPAPQGAWSRRVQEAGAPDMRAVSDALAAASTELHASRSAHMAQLMREMANARAAVPDAAAQARLVAEHAPLVRAALAEAQRPPGMSDVPSAASDALATVHALAQVKQRMQTARDMLEAADSWSLVEADVRSFLTDAQWERAARRLAAMGQSLDTFDASSEYVAAQRALHTRLLGALDDTVSPALSAAVRNQDMDTVVQCARVFAIVHREASFVQSYLVSRSEGVRTAWAESGASVPVLAAALVHLAREEATVFVPQLCAQTTAALLTATVAALDPPLSVALRDRPLPAIADAYRELRVTSQQLVHWEREAATTAAVAEPLCLPELPCDWASALAEAFRPHQRAYRALEAACLEHAYAAQRGAFQTQLDRILVGTSADTSEAWMEAVQRIAALLHEQIDVGRALTREAFARAGVLIGARGADGLVAALTTALYPAVTARLCAATETLRLRYVQHVRAAPVADVLAADDMDAVHDWDLVQAGARLLDATRDVEQLLSDALATTHALDGPSDALHEAALRSIPAAGARVAEDIAPPTKLIHAAQSFVLELLLSAFRRHVEAYAAHGAWTMQERLGDARVKVPTFSRSPTEGMVRLGEGLLNLPRLLEALVERELRAFQYAVDELPFAHDDEGATQRATRRSHRSLSVSMLTGGAPADEGGVATADHVLSLWLRSLTLTLLAALRDETLPRIAAQHNCDRAQLAADLDYLGNIASALNASCPPLRAWVDVLQLEGPAPADSPLRATRAHAVVWGVVRG